MEHGGPVEPPEDDGPPAWLHRHEYIITANAAGMNKALRRVLDDLNREE